MKKYISLMLIFSLCFLFTACKAPEKEEDIIPDTELTEEERKLIEIAEFERELFNILNEKRKENSLEALKLDEKLNICAKTRAEEGLTDFSHERPDGSRYTSIFAENEIRWDAEASEILARYFKTAKKAMDTIMDSDEQSKTALYAGFTRVGIGIAPSEEYEGYYCVELLFMGPEGSY